MLITHVATISFCLASSIGQTFAFSVTARRFEFSAATGTFSTTTLHMSSNNNNDDDDLPAGSFFNPVPDGDSSLDYKPSFDEKISELIKERQKPPLAATPSTISGKPTKGFGKKTTSSSPKKSFIPVGPPVNNPTKPEYDDQGFILYTNEETGEKERVFEALVDYPCEFTMKIVGANEGTFVEDMVAIVADSCDEHHTRITYSTRTQGKWMSVTVQAPVKNAEMLYMLYENVDRDPRVKFKF